MRQYIRQKNAVDICEGPIFCNIWKFAWPFILTALFQRLYHAADMIVVGRYAGPEALAGVGTTSSLTNTIINLFLGLSVGVKVVLAKALGAKDEDCIQRTVHTAISVSLVAGLIISLMGTIFTVPLLQMTGVPADVMHHAKSYMRILFVGQVAAMVYNFGAAILHSKGDAGRPLYIISISGVINIVLNLFFVICVEMAAAGVALATVISQTFTAVAVLVLLMREKSSVRLQLKKLRIYKKEIMDILKVGIPSGMQSMIFSLSNVIVQSGVNSFGTAAIAGSAAAADIVTFYYIVKNAFVQVTVTFVSQNIGAGKYDRLKKILKLCALNMGLLWVAEVLVTLFAGKYLLGIYVPGDPEAIRMGMIRLTIVGCTYGIFGLNEYLCAALRGMGYSFSTMLISLIGVCGIRIVWLFTVFQAVKTFEVLFVSFALSWIGTFIMLMIWFSYVWRKKKF